MLAGPLIGDLPNFYIYASNNPSEGTLAKRRTGAALISYLTPPVANAGLYRGLVDLKASLDRWRALEPDVDAEQRTSLAALIQAQAAAVELASAEPQWDGDVAARIECIRTAVLELEYTLIPHGLHVIGEPPDAAARAEMLDAAGIPTPNGGPRSTHCWPPITRLPRSCTRSTAAISGPRPVAICCATAMFCPPAATCTASIRFVFRVRSQ